MASGDSSQTKGCVKNGQSKSKSSQGAVFIDIGGEFLRLQSLSWVHVGVGGRVMEYSPAFRKLLGLEEKMELSFAQLFCAEDLKSELPHAQSILVANQEELFASAHFLHKDGSSVPVSLIYKRVGEEDVSRDCTQAFGVPMFVIVCRSAVIPGSKMNGAIAAADDLDESFLISAELLQSQHKLVRSLNHRLRAPLTVMSLSVNLMRDYADRMTTSERIEEIRQLEESIAVCQKILEQAIAQTKVENDPTPGNAADRFTRPSPVSSAKGIR